MYYNDIIALAWYGCRWLSRARAVRLCPRNDTSIVSNQLPRPNLVVVHCQMLYACTCTYCKPDTGKTPFTVSMAKFSIWAREVFNSQWSDPYTRISVPECQSVVSTDLRVSYSGAYCQVGGRTSLATGKEHCSFMVGTSRESCREGLYSMDTKLARFN